jgi:hypothetical protein
MTEEGKEDDAQAGNNDNAVTTAESSAEELAAVDAATAEQGHEKDEEAKQKTKKTLVAVDAPWSERMWEVFYTFWPLGFVAFGGPQVRSRSTK